MLTRKVTDSLLRWEASRGHKALFITGARQVGKTTAIRAFAKKRYRSFAELNFLQDPRAREIFSGSLNANTIVSNLTAFLRMPLEPGSTWSCSTRSKSVHSHVPPSSFLWRMVASTMWRRGRCQASGRERGTVLSSGV